MKFKSQNLFNASLLVLLASLNSGISANDGRLVKQCTKQKICKQLDCLEETLQKNCNSDKKRHNCTKGVTPIFAKDIHKNGYLITKSGVYCLAEDAVFNPCKNDSAAITINADNVVLDLNQHEISSPLDNKQLNNVGIFVTSNHKDVTIKNGTVRNIGALGIRVEGGNNVINLLDLIVKFCGGRGERPLAQPDVSGSSFISGGISINGQTGLLDNQIFNVLVRNVQCYANTADAKSSNLASTLAAGISGVFIKNLVIDQCISNDNFHPGTRAADGTLGTAGTGRGIGLSGITDLVITDCVTNGNNGALASAGISVSPTNGGEIVNCLADGNFSGPGPVTLGNGTTPASTKAATGFDSSDSDNIVWQNCVAKNTFAISKVNGTPIGARGPQVMGFLTQHSNNVLVENCVAINTHGGSVASGFKHASILLGRGNNVVFRNCKSLGTNNFFPLDDPQFDGSRITWGFQTLGTSLAIPVVGTVFESCYAEGTVNFNGAPDLVAGFDIRFADRCEVLNSFSVANTTTGAITPGNGINVVNSVSCKIDRNEVSFSGKGIFVSPTQTIPNVATNNLISRNLAFNNTAGLNYVGVVGTNVVKVNNQVIFTNFSDPNTGPLTNFAVPTA